MNNKELEARKEKIIKFVKEKKNLIQYILLIAILWLAYFIRSQNWGLLRDATTGRYISLELDSTLFLRYAQYIAEHGRLYAVDVMRNYPLGVNIDFGVFTSYFVAYMYKIVHVFVPSFTVEFADVVYPTVATVIAALFLFLFVRRLFDYRVALLSSLFLVTVPTFLYRSISSDHDILGIMFIFMTLYFFIVAWQSKKIRNNIIFGVCAAFTSILGYNTAGNMAIFFMIVGIFTLIHILLDSVKKSDIYVYSTWYLVNFSVLLGTGKLTLNRFLSDHTSSLPATIVFLTLCAYLLFNIKSIKHNKFIQKLLTKVPQGFAAFFLVIVFSVLFLISFFGFDFFMAMIRGFFSIFSSAFVGNRWASTVAENRRIFVIDWFSSFGWLLVWLFIIGLIILLYKLVKHLKDYKKLFYVYVTCVLAFIFSKYSEGSILNGKSLLSNILFYGSIIVLVGYTLYYYVKNYYEAGISSTIFTIELDPRYTFILVIALINIVGGTSAIRLFFELSTFVVIFSSFALIYIVDYCLSLKYTLLKYLAVILFVFVLFNPFSFAKGIIFEDIQSSYNQVKFSGPAYHSQWQSAGKWVRENTPKDAVFNHWWDYGYWVQSGFERTTVTDGGNRIGWWNYLTARNVLTAPNDSDALGFLYAHNVSYLLIIGDEVGKYSAYSLIGSDKNFDRYSYLTYMGLDSSLSKETRNGTLLVYTGGYPLDEDFVYNSKVYPKGTAIIGALIPLVNTVDNEGNVVSASVMQPKIVLQSQGEQLQLTVKCLYIDKLYYFGTYDYGGCIKVIPAVQGNQLNRLGAAIFVSRRVSESMFARLYLFGQDSKYFNLVYDDSSNIPLGLYNGRSLGPIKIWKVNYPDGFSLDKSEYNYYTRREFPDLSLTQF